MKRRNEVSDSRINQTAVDLFKLARAMLAQGFRDDSREFYEVANGLHRALNLRPWQIDVLDFELYAMTPEAFPSHAGYDLVKAVAVTYPPRRSRRFIRTLHFENARRRRAFGPCESVASHPQ